MKLLYIVYSNINYDQRVQQELNSISKIVDTFSISIGDIKETNGNMYINPGKIGFLKFPIAWALFLLKTIQIKPDILMFADINTAPVAIFYKILFAKPIIFDMHEIGSEMEANSNYFKKLIWKILEFITIRYSDHIITINNSLMGYLHKYSDREVTVLFNYPSNRLFNRSTTPKRKNFVYIGNLSSGRGLEHLVRTFLLKQDANLKIIGNGILKNTLRKIADSALNIEFYDTVPLEHLTQYLLKEGTGFILTEGTCLNHYYSLPNKVFQYLQLGIPFITSDLPELKALVESTGAGVAVKVSEEGIKSGIDEIMNHYKKYRKAAKNIKYKYVWENQESLLLDVIKRFI